MFDRWKTLDPKQRLLITVGVPVVVLAALYVALRGKKKPAPAEAEPKTVVTGAPQFSDGGSDQFNLVRQLTAMLEDQNQNGTPLIPAPPTIITLPVPTIVPVYGHNDPVPGQIYPTKPAADPPPDPGPVYGHHDPDGTEPARPPPAPVTYAPFNWAGLTDQDLWDLCNGAGVYAPDHAQEKDQIYGEMMRRGQSVNDPRFGGPENPTACGRGYVLFLLAHGYHG